MLILFRELATIVLWVLAFTVIQNTIGVSVRAAWEERKRVKERDKQLKSYFKD